MKVTYPSRRPLKTKIMLARKRVFYCWRGKHAHKMSMYDQEGKRGACIWCLKPMPVDHEVRKAYEYLNKSGVFK